MTNRKLLICGIWCAGKCRNIWLMKYGFFYDWKGSSIHNWNPHPCITEESFPNAKLCQVFIIIIIIIIIIFITFIQDIYNYIPETNPVSRVYSVAGVLYLQFVLHAVLFHTWNMFCTFTLVLSEVCMQCPILLFFVVPRFCAFLVCCSGIVWVILRWFHLPLLLLVSFSFLHFTYAVFLL